MDNPQAVAEERSAEGPEVAAARRATLLLCTWAALREAGPAPGVLAAAGVWPLVLPPWHDDWCGERPEWDAAVPRGWAAEVGSLVGGPWLAALWVENRGRVLLPAEDGPGWERIRAHVAAYGEGSEECRGVLFDLEHYSQARNMSGPMKPRKAWPDGEALAERAAEIAGAVRGLVGGYVATRDLQRVPGLRAFVAALGQAAAGRGVLLDETYTGWSTWDEGRVFGLRVFRGHQGPGRAGRRPAGSWVYDPRGRVLRAVAGRAGSADER